MSRYIDAEWIRNIYADFEHYENRDDWTTPITNVLAVIDDAPSIDIVRCKECRHSFINENHPQKPRICGLTKMCGTTKDDWFCADGERREP